MTTGMVFPRVWCSGVPTSITGLIQAQIDIANGYLADRSWQSARTGISIYLNFDPANGAPAQTPMG